MQSAVSMSSRGAVAAALLLSVSLFVPAEYALSATVVVSPELVTERGASERRVVVDDDWQHASYLAWTIKHRRYGDIAAAAAQIEEGSPYARWVPTAMALAVEQLDTTARAYARMGRCRELGAFQRRVGEVWSAGRAAMRAQSCGVVVCKRHRRGLYKMFGGAAAVRSVQQVLAGERYTERVLEIDHAIRTGDHAAALASCAAIGQDGPVPAMCLVEACRAGELAIAEVLLPHGDDRARAACADAGITFASGSGIAYASGAWRTHPADLVHVHPDAPRAADARVD